MQTCFEQIHNTKFAAALAHFIDTNGEVPSEIWLRHAESIKESLAAPSMSKSLTEAAIARSNVAMTHGAQIEPTKSKNEYVNKELMGKEGKYVKQLQHAEARLEKVDIHRHMPLISDLGHPPPQEKCYTHSTFQVRFDVAKKVGCRLVKDVGRCGWGGCCRAHR